MSFKYLQYNLISGSIKCYVILIFVFTSIYTILGRFHVLCTSAYHCSDLKLPQSMNFKVSSCSMWSLESIKLRGRILEQQLRLSRLVIFFANVCQLSSGLSSLITPPWIYMSILLHQVRKTSCAVWNFWFYFIFHIFFTGAYTIYTECRSQL